MFAFIPIVLDVICLLHVARSGRDRIWAYIIIGLPVIGALAYIVTEMLPEYLRSYHGRTITNKAIKKIAPERNLKQHADRLEIADTVQNRMRLAEENLRLGRYDEAAAIYRAALAGVYADDIALLMGLARATTALGLHAETLEVLDRLRTAHPDFQSNEAHLIYARSLEGLGRTDEALEEYAVLVNHAPGEEVRCRYAMLLQRKGQEEDARSLFAEIVKRVDRAPYRYVKSEKEWFEIAKRNGSTG